MQRRGLAGHDGVPPVKVPFFKRSGAEILHKYVGGPDQPARQCLSFCAPEIKRDAPLVTADDGPPYRVALVHAPLPHWIAGTRRFNLNHVGAQIGKQLPTKRAGDESAQFDDAQSGKGSSGIGVECFHGVLIFKQLLQHGMWKELPVQENILL